MGLGLAAIKLNLELWQRGLFAGMTSVLDLGSQELHLDASDFDQAIKSAGIKDYDKDKFVNLANWPAQPRCSAKPFYELLGIDEYACIDMNQAHGSIAIDLAQPLDRPDLLGRYDLVTDHGTNEHVFNVPEAYRTMHRLCKKQGMMIICQVVYGGNGYYTFDLSFFEGLAAANNYKILFSSYVVGTDRLTPNGSNPQFHLPLSRDLFSLLDVSKVTEIGICYVFQKLSDADFQYPYQGAYLAKQQGHFGYELQFLPDPPSRVYLPLYDFNNLPISTKQLVRLLGARLGGKLFR